MPLCTEFTLCIGRSLKFTLTSVNSFNILIKSIYNDREQPRGNVKRELTQPLIKKAKSEHVRVMSIRYFHRFWGEWMF